MTPTMRRVMLTTHVASSVGWLGAVMSFLALSIIGTRGADPAVVRACYIAMNLIGLFVIVPCSMLALLTGTIQALSTPWGLFRYYWVLVKFALTIGATALLLLHQFTAVARAAAQASTGIGPPQIGRLATQLIFDSGFAALVLLVTTTLSVFKPWGKIPSVEQESAFAAAVGTPGILTGRPLGVRIVIILVGLLLVTVVVVHIMGGGMRHGM